MSFPILHEGTRVQREHERQAISGGQNTQSNDDAMSIWNELLQNYGYDPAIHEDTHQGSSPTTIDDNAPRRTDPYELKNKWDVGGREYFLPF